MTIGGIKWNIPLGGYPPAWFVLNDFVGELDHVCDAEGFLIGLGGRGNLCVGPSFLGCVPVPGEFFRISNMMLAHQYPFRFILRGGTPSVLGFPVGNATAVLNFSGHPLGMHTDGWLNIGGIMHGAAGVAVSLTRLALLGQLEGSLQIPDFACARTSYGCRAIKSAVAWAAGTLPVKINGFSATIDGVVTNGGTSFTGAIRGLAEVGPLSLAAQVGIDASGYGLLIGANYENMIDLNPFATVAAQHAAVERGIPLTGAERNVILAVTSATATVPSLSLRTPAGATVTPANVGSFPGVQHLANASEATAAFVVAAPAAGCVLWCDASVPATAAVDGEVTLAASPTLDGCSAQASYDWDFGDGSPHSAEVGPHHAWTVDGVYDWLVTVSADGTSCVSSGTITVGLGARRPVRRQLTGRPPQSVAP